MAGSILILILIGLISFLGLLYMYRGGDNGSGEHEDNDQQNLARSSTSARGGWAKLKTVLNATKKLDGRRKSKVKFSSVHDKDLPSFMLEPKRDLIGQDTKSEDENSNHMENILRNIGFNDESMRKELCNNLDIKHLAGGNLLFDHGDEDNCIYLVRRGVLTMFIADEDGSEVPVRDFRADEAIYSYLSIMDVLAGVPSVFKTLSVVAREDSTVCCLPVEALKHACQQTPKLKIQVAKTMLCRLQRITFQTLHSFFGLTKELLASRPKEAISKQLLRDRSIRRLSVNERRYEGAALKKQKHVTKSHGNVPLTLDTIQEGNENNNATEKLVDEKTKQLEDSGLLSRITLQLKGLLGIEDENLLKECVGLVMFQPSVTIMKEGSQETRVVYIVSGSVNMVQKNQQGIQKTVYRFHPGELLGETAVMTEESQSYAIKSGKSGAVIATISASNFHRIIDEHPDAAIRISHYAVKRMSKFTRQTDFTLEWGYLEYSQVLFNRDDHADTIFMVLCGRLRSVVTRDDGSKHIVEEFGKGSLVGLDEVLTGKTRLSTVHAIRDTEFTKIPNGTLSYIKRKFPSSVTGRVMQTVGNRLSTIIKENKKEDDRDDAAQQRQNLSTIVLVPMSNAVPISVFSRELALRLSQIGSTKRITSREVAHFLGNGRLEKTQKLQLTSWINQQEDTHDTILLQTDDTVTEWTKLCFRQGDLILLMEVVDREPNEIGEMEKELDLLQIGTQRELVLLHKKTNGTYKDPVGTAEWLNAREWCHRVHHIRCPDRFMVRGNSAMKHLDTGDTDVTDDVGRLSRYLTGTSVGLVLGGGGARGLSHVGFIKAMLESDIPIDMIGGTSIGSFVGACYSSNTNLTSLEKMARLLCKRMNSILQLALDLTYPYLAMFSGRGFNNIIREVLGERKIEDLWIPYFCVTTDITDSKKRVHSNGSLWRYVRSSMSLAGYFPPLCDPKDKHLLLDGGYVSNLPVEVMKARGAGVILAVDVGGVSETDFFDFGDDISGWWMLWNKWNPMKHKPKIPDLPEIHNRLSYVANNSMRNMDDTSYHYVRPDIVSFGLTMFDKYEEIRDRGYVKGTQIFRGMPNFQIHKSKSEWQAKSTNDDILTEKLHSVIHAVTKFEHLHNEDYETDEEDDPMLTT
ncbi:patatin-like phospholipase domain-containing protein 7 isoform X2 [Apostichopus japonicus]|uniref:patatin-like phospholipase domain-containing protein 7 isoform X2 n=1 Tax=Stichopus japonicus TaxID=307972 RepID=UPI003AB70193